MRRTVTLLALLLGLVLVAASPAGAVTGNFQKDFEHEYVGLIVFYDANGEFLWRCSGSLLTDRVFLTAGHCTDQNAEESPVSARIYFEQDAGAHYDPALGYDPVTGYPLYGGITAHTLYDYGFDDFAGFPNNRDIGLVILDAPVQTVYPNIDTYASLAAPGSLDRLATRRGQQEVTFTISGYGVSLVNPVRTVSYRERLMATTELVNLRSALTGGFNLQLTANPGGGKGGTCFGDSGGPILYDATDVIVAVNSFVLNGNCAGVAFAYRTDQQAVIDWILAHAGSEADEINIVSI
jgi:Trypsin